MIRPMDLSHLTDGWPAAHVAAAVMRQGEVVASTGDGAHRFELASVTKLLTAWAVLVAVEEETVDLDETVSDAGATLADVLAHAGGLGPDGDQLAEPRTRRIYSNAGYDLLGDVVAGRSGMTFAAYLRAAVLDPLGMASTTLDGSPAHAAASTLDDLVAFARELLRPTLLAPTTVELATGAHLPDLVGVLPGYGRQEPNPWGLGPEIRGSKDPHWSAPSAGPDLFGHFGQAGTFLWVEPGIDAACVVLTDEAFGPWAVEAWAPFNESVRQELVR